MSEERKIDLTGWGTFTGDDVLALVRTVRAALLVKRMEDSPKRFRPLGFSEALRNLNVLLDQFIESPPDPDTGED